MGQLVNIRSFKLYYKIIWNSSWNFSNKYAYITNIMEDVYLEKFIYGSLYKISAGIFFFSHVRIEKIFNNYFFDIFFFDDFAATYFNNSIDTRNYKYRYTFLNKYVKKYSVNSKKFNLEDFFKRITNYKRFLLNLVNKNLTNKLSNNLLNRIDFFNLKYYTMDIYNSKNKIKEFLFYSNKFGFDRFVGLNYKSFNFFYLFKNRLKRRRFFRFNRNKRRRFSPFTKVLFKMSNNHKIHSLNFQTKKIYNIINNAYYSFNADLQNLNKKNLYFFININNFFKKIRLKDYLYFKKIQISNGLSIKYYFNTELSLNFFILKNKSPFFSLKISKQYFKYFNICLNIFNLLNVNNIIFLKKLIYETNLNFLSLNILSIDKLKYKNNDRFFFSLFIDSDSFNILFNEDAFRIKPYLNYSFFLNNIFLLSDSGMLERIKKISKIFHYFIPEYSFRFLDSKPNNASKNVGLKALRVFTNKFIYLKKIRNFRNNFINLKFYKRFLILNLFLQRVKNYHFLFLASMKYLKKMNKKIDDRRRRFYFYSIRRGLAKLNKKTKINNLKYLFYFKRLKRRKIYFKLSKLFKYNIHNNKIKLRILKAWSSRTHYKTFKHLFREYLNIQEVKPQIYMNKHLISLGFYKDDNNAKNKIVKNNYNSRIKKKEDEEEFFFDENSNHKFFSKFLKLLKHVESVNGLSVRENISNNFLMSICFFLFFFSNEQFFKKLKVIELFFYLKFLKIFRNENKIFCFNFFLLKDPTPEIVSLYITQKFYVKLSLPSFVKSMVHTITRNFSNISGIFVKCKGRFTRRQRAANYAFIAGKVPLNDFNSYILYFNRIRVFNTGVGSIKVWMSYRSKLNYIKVIV